MACRAVARLKIVPASALRASARQPSFLLRCERRLACRAVARRAKAGGKCW
jgi:hypothetical protein